MTDELKALREEVAKLRERVAVLEARPAWTPPVLIGPNQVSPYQPPHWVTVQPYVLPTITCGAASLGMGDGGAAGGR